jgi:Flagellar biosynthesis protein, FliO
MKWNAHRGWSLLVGVVALGAGIPVAGQEPDNPLRFGELHVQSTPLADAEGWPDSRAMPNDAGPATTNPALGASHGSFARTIDAQMARPPASHEPARDVRRLPLPEVTPPLRDELVQPANAALSSAPGGRGNETADLESGPLPAPNDASGWWTARARGSQPPGRKPFAGPAGLEVSSSIRQLAFATLVSLLGVVVIVMVSKTVRRNQRPMKSPAADGPRVEQTLALGNKSLLRVVRVGKQQVLVATDATGIRSIVPVPGEFGELVDEPAEEQITPEQEQFFNHLMERLNARPRHA